MSRSLASLIAPGFFASEAVHVARRHRRGWPRSSSGTVGVFTVMRGQSFAGEALGDIGTDRRHRRRSWPASGRCGASSAIDVAAVAVMELIGVQRPRGRDLATGIVLGAALGLAALLLYLGTIYHNTTGAAVDDPVRLGVHRSPERPSRWSRC